MVCLFVEFHCWIIAETVRLYETYNYSSRNTATVNTESILSTSINSAHAVVRDVTNLHLNGWRESSELCGMNNTVIRDQFNHTET